MKHSLLTGILTGIALLLALLALGLLLVFSLRGLYLSGIDDWNLTAYSGLSREEILSALSALR